jgi:hypothetical protein
MKVMNLILSKLTVLCTVNGTLIDGICNQHDCDPPTYVLHHNSTGQTNNSSIQHAMGNRCMFSIAGTCYDRLEHCWENM